MLKKRSKKQIWDMAEEKLNNIVKEWAEWDEHPYVDFMVALIISSGRDKDEKWIEGDGLKFCCALLGLDEEYTRKYILYTLEHTKKKRKANFYDNIDDEL